MHGAEAVVVCCWWRRRGRDRPAAVTDAHLRGVRLRAACLHLEGQRALAEGVAWVAAEG